MRKIFYIILALLISIAHILILNSWLSDTDFSHSPKELSFEGGEEGAIFADSVAISPNIQMIKNLQTLK